MLEITHSAEEGSLVRGDPRPHHQLVKDAGFRWSRQGFWYLPNSRDKTPRTGMLERLAEQLREAGFEVGVNIDSERRSIAEREADRADRVEQRQAGLQAKAERLERASNAAHERASSMASVIPFGQPILVGHHSEGRDRRYRARIHDTMDKAVRLGSEAQDAADRAKASEANQRHRESVPTTLRRIDRLETELRDIDRKLAGEFCFTSEAKLKAEFAHRTEFHCRYCSKDLAVVDGKVEKHYGQRPPASGGWQQRLTNRKDALVDEIAYWKSYVTEAEANGVKVWSKADFEKGDFVKSRFGWHEVVRVNAKSVTVKTDHSWTDTLPYDRVLGQRAGQEQP